MTSDWLVFGVVFAVSYMVVLGLYKRREGIAYFVRRFIIFGATYLAVVLYLSESVKLNPLASVAVTVIAGLAVDRLVPKRSRYISRAERQKAITRYESETGQKYNPRRHDLGHVVPFKDGGSNAADNLTVEWREENRAKGAKSPWWDVLGGSSARRRRRR